MDWYLLLLSYVVHRDSDRNQLVSGSGIIVVKLEDIDQPTSCPKEAARTNLC